LSSLEKTFTVIEAVVSEQELGLPFSAIVARTNLPKASVHRILKGLTTMGYLTFNVETKRYRGSLKLAAIGAEVMANFDLRNLLHPQLLKLHQGTHHTCNIGILNYDHGIFIDKIESQDYGIRLISGIGKSFPLHSTALGKVLLAHSPAAAEKFLRRKLKAYTDKTITRTGLLKKELAVIRKQGYAIDKEEITRGIICVAAPVFRASEEVVCAISIAFPSYFQKDRGIKPEIDAVKHHAALMSGSFG
jgi:IclR family transcriptional regulator, KDG regulon repressor